jgi:hypothetical protein
MGNPDPRNVVNEVLGTIGSIGGAEKGAGGIFIGPGGKIVKVPPRQDLQALVGRERDELIVQTIQVLAQDLSDARLKQSIAQAASAAAR